MSGLRIVVTGLIAQYPLGGVTWDYIQYPIGLSQLGHDVYYLEDTGQWPYNPQEEGVAKSCEFNVRYLKDCMDRFGMGSRWAYRFPWESRWFGMPDADRAEVIATADLLINVSGSLANPGEYRRIPRMAYVDSDPVFTQLKLARGQDDFRRIVDLHDVHFSFGERLSPGVPETGHSWQPTRQPVVLDEWRTSDQPRTVFTTVMNWTSYKAIDFQGQSYGQKDVEFERFFDLPESVPEAVFEVAVNAGKTRRTPRGLLGRKGWKVVDPAVVCPDLDSYRSYIQTSFAEWSVAKGGYVKGAPGWFSCRSACYLAAGRPVVVQDAGFGDVLPVGEGIVPFRTPAEAIAGVRDVQARYELHAKAAASIANEYFDARSVLEALLEGVFRPARPTVEVSG